MASAGSGECVPDHTVTPASEDAGGTFNCDIVADSRVDAVANDASYTG